MVNQALGYMGYFDRESCDLDEFKVLTSQNLTPADAPQAADIVRNVPIYDMAALRPALEDPEARRALLTEWGHILRHSSGVIALKRAYADTAVLDRATRRAAPACVWSPRNLFFRRMTLKCFWMRL